MTATQIDHPWRATIRTVIQAVIAAAAAAPLVYTAITQDSPGASTGAAAVFLAVAGAVTRVAALPAVDQFIRRFIPCLAPEPIGPRPRQTPADDGRQSASRSPADADYSDPGWN